MSPASKTDWRSEPGCWTIARHEGRRYETALFGKMHFMPIRADHRVRGQPTCEHLYAGYGPGTEDDYATGWAPAAGEISAPTIRPTVFPYPAEYHPTSWITSKPSISYSRGIAARPFFAVVFFTSPHTPLDPPGPYASMYRREDQTIASDGREANEALPSPFRDALLDEGTLHPKFRKPHHLHEFTTQELQAARAATRALIRQIDDAVSTLITAVDLANTFVWFTSDHGDFGTHRGLAGKVPWIPFDDLARVPTFGVGAGVAGGGRRLGAPMQSFDFTPTVLSMAGVSSSRFRFRRSRSDVSAQRHSPSRTPSGRCSSETRLGWPMIRIGNLKRIWHRATGSSIVFDLAVDPGERRRYRWRTRAWQLHGPHTNPARRHHGQAASTAAGRTDAPTFAEGRHRLAIMHDRHPANR